MDRPASLDRMTGYGEKIHFIELHRVEGHAATHVVVCKKCKYDDKLEEV